MEIDESKKKKDSSRSKGEQTRKEDFEYWYDKQVKEQNYSAIWKDTSSTFEIDLLRVIQYWKKADFSKTLLTLVFSNTKDQSPVHFDDISTPAKLVEPCGFGMICHGYLHHESRTFVWYVHESALVLESLLVSYYETRCHGTIVPDFLQRLTEAWIEMVRYANQSKTIEPCRLKTIVRRVNIGFK